MHAAKYVFQTQSTSKYFEVLKNTYRTRRFIGEELILAIGDFSENSPILNPPTLILCHKDTPTKLHAYAILLRTRVWILEWAWHGVVINS